MLKDGTICSKHDRIKDFLERANYLLVEAMDDGERMEKGLDEKRATIKELREELDDANNKIKKLEEYIVILENEKGG